MSHIWMVPTYRTRTWPYRQAPAANDHIRYMNDGFDVRVQRIHARYVLFTDGTMMRRHLEWGMIWAWIERHKLRIKGYSWRHGEGKRTTWMRPEVLNG